MRRPLLALAALLLAIAPLRAQTAADSSGVRQAAMDYLNGFYTGDSTLHVRSIRPEVYKFGFWRQRDSVRYAAGEQMKWGQFHDFTRRVKARGQAPNPSWPRDVRVLDVLDQTAAAKVTAWWGTDYLLLGKFDGRWMITHVLWQSPPPRATAAR
jgi:hypothetical protein